VTALLDSHELESAHVVGNSMGGRVALELGLSHADRIRRLVLLAPSLAWLKPRPWAPYLRLIPTQLGIFQPTSRVIVEMIVKQFVPARTLNGWRPGSTSSCAPSSPAGPGRVLRRGAQHLSRGAARPGGLWTTLGSLTRDVLFVWGRKDNVVPIGFA
jgi:pimeloyl-ACP methyl ester carboxylesterase